MTDAPNLYYHGTWVGYADAIMTRGFELGHEGHGHLLGRGVYIAQTLAAAALWTPDFVICCRLQPGTRILWVDDDYDRRTIRSLRREFGKELLALGPHFYKAIPNNKRLTQYELIQLCGYVLMRARRQRWRSALRPRKGKNVQYRGAWLRLSRLHDQVKRHGYDAIGDRSFSAWDADEILVFNPARVIPVSAHWLTREGDYFDGPQILSPPIEIEALRVYAAQTRAEEEEE